MKVTAGHMWDSMQDKGPIISIVAPLLIVPALGGALVCYSVCLCWIVYKWPFWPVFSVSLLLALGYTYTFVRGFLKEMRNGNLDVEKLIRSIGLVMAILLTVLWLNPKAVRNMTTKDGDDLEQGCSTVSSEGAPSEEP